MNAPPINSARPANAQPSSSTGMQALEQRHRHEDAIARFHQMLRDVAPTTANTDAAKVDSGVDSGNAPDPERRDPNTSTVAVAATIGSQHHSFAPTTLAAEPMIAADTTEAARLIEQATSVMIERATRSDQARFIVSLDHAIAGGAAAEFVRDGAFLYVRLLARTDASYRSMWTHRAELQERLAASTGLQTRVEILEVHGDGSPA